MIKQLGGPLGRSLASKRRERSLSDDRRRWLQWLRAQLCWRLNGRPGENLRAESRRAYEEGDFDRSASLALQALGGAPEDCALRLEVAQWSRFGLVDLPTAKGMLRSVVNEGPPHLARRAAIRLLNFSWEREGALSAAQELPLIEPWLRQDAAHCLRMGALLQDAGRKEEACLLLSDLHARKPDALAKAGYLDLVLMAGEERIAELPQLNVARSMAARLETGARRFEEIVAGWRDIALVANGPRLKGRGLGRRIDSHRLVMRFNNHLGGVAGQEEDLGVRADIWMRPPRASAVPWRAPPHPSMIILTGANLRRSFADGIGVLTAMPDDLRNVAIVPPNLYLDLSRRLHAAPSSGILGLAMVAERSGGQVPASQVYGYSLDLNTENSSSYHWGVEVYDFPTRHNWKREWVLFQSLVTGGAF